MRLRPIHVSTFPSSGHIPPWFVEVEAEVTTPPPTTPAGRTSRFKVEGHWASITILTRNSFASHRHGWGCTPDPERAVHYLSAAASNSASVEQLALQAGLKKGGAAKGELVLAIFELANCFRHGWGIREDPVAAKQVSPGGNREMYR